MDDTTITAAITATDTKAMFLEAVAAMASAMYDGSHDMSPDLFRTQDLVAEGYLGGLHITLTVG